MWVHTNVMALWTRSKSFSIEATYRQSTCTAQVYQLTHDMARSPITPRPRRRLPVQRVGPSNQQKELVKGGKGTGGAGSKRQGPGVPKMGLKSPCDTNLNPVRNVLPDSSKPVLN